MTEADQNFIQSFETIMERVAKTERDHLFDTGAATPEKGLAKIALMHSELSEATEAVRKGNGETLIDEHCPEFFSLEVELADTIIRIMTFAHARNLRVAQALLVKATYNDSRPPKHGKDA